MKFHSFDKPNNIKSNKFFFVCDLLDIADNDKISHIGLVIKHKKKYNLFEYNNKRITLSQVSKSYFNNKGLSVIKILDNEFNQLIDSIINQINRFILKLKDNDTQIIFKFQFNELLDILNNTDDSSSESESDNNLKVTCSLLLVYIIKSIINIKEDNPIILPETWPKCNENIEDNIYNIRISPLHCLNISIPSDISLFPLNYDFCSENFFNLPE